MPTRQYIGARYVPQFYDNPDDGTSNWKSGVVYEPLTMVLYNSATYTSKKEVPQTVGDPASNPDYWVATGNYNGQIAYLQSEIGTLADLKTSDKSNLVAAINEVDNKFATPEMYGAVGDGVADDTSAINAALAASQTVICRASYKITSPIVIPAKKKIIVDGIISYDGADGAFNISERYTTIEGHGIIESNGDYAIKITAARGAIKDVSLSVTGNYTACLIIESASILAGVAYLNIDHIFLYGRDSNIDYGTGIYIHTLNDGFINENMFTAVAPVYFEDGLKIYNESSGTINRNKFIQYDSEGCTRHLYAYSTGAYIIDNEFDMRVEEFGNSARIFLDKYVIHNKFRARGFAPKNFSVINPDAKTLFTAPPAFNNIIEGWILTNSGVTFGYNGSFHVNGDIVVFDINSKTEGSAYYAVDFAIDYSTSILWPMSEFVIYTSTSSIVIDLNYRSDWCTSPIDLIKITNPAGTTVTIKNDNTVLFGPTLLPQGLHKCRYDTQSKNVIYVNQIVTE